MACLLGVLVLPMSRGDGDFQAVAIRVGALAFVALVAAIVLAWTPLVALAAALVAGVYAVELAIAGAPLDVASPAVAAGLLLCAELAYWSHDERTRWHGDAGDGLRRAALVALLGAATFLAAAILLVLVDAVRARGLALDLVGAVAAAAVIATALVVARESRQPSNGA